VRGEWCQIGYFRRESVKTDILDLVQGQHISGLRIRYLQNKTESHGFPVDADGKNSSKLVYQRWFTTDE
jgi:hypothetical protein